jgi:glycosyltransferase involved in cell wall biosynthesis
MLSVIVPTYNAESRIVNTLRRLNKVRDIGEVVVVDDGSGDKTAAVARKYADKVVSYKANHGKGYAMRKGVAAARGDTICFIDDSQFEPTEISKLLKKMKKSNLDMVIGDRGRKIPQHRQITNYLQRVAVFISTGVWPKDVLCGFRIIKKRKFQDLKTQENGYAIEAETLFKSIMKGQKIGWVPVKVFYNEEKRGLFKSANRSITQICMEASYTLKTVVSIWLGVFR